MGLLLLVVLRAALDTRFATLTADPVSVAHLPPYAGFLSNLGILFWSAGAAVSLWSFAVTGPGSAPAQHRRLVLHGGLLTLLLCLDDLFMGHESVGPILTGLGEEVFLAGLAALLVAFIVVHAKLILSGGWEPLAAALVGFLVMMVFDVLEHRVQIPAHQLWEEGAKFTGVVCWNWWMMLAARRLVACKSP